MFICQICEKNHRTLQKKINCERRGVEEIKFKKGDIVSVRGKFVKIYRIEQNGHHVECKGHLMKDTGYDDYRCVSMEPFYFMQTDIEKLSMSAKEYDQKRSVCFRLEKEVEAVIKKVTGREPKSVIVHLDYEGNYRVNAK